MTLPPARVDQFKARITEIVADAHSLTIETDEDRLLVARRLQAVKALAVTITDFVAPFDEAAAANLEAVRGRRKELLEPLEQDAEPHLKKLLADHQKERERLNQAEAQRRLETAKAEAERDRDRRADEIEGTGDTETAERVRAQPVRPTVEPETLPTKPDKIPGVQFRTRWTAELAPDGLATLVKAIAEGHPGASLGLVNLNKSQADALARALGEELNRLEIGLIARSQLDVAAQAKP